MYTIAVPKKEVENQTAHKCQLQSQPRCWISAISQFIYPTLPFSQFCHVHILTERLILAKQQFHLRSYYYCYSLSILPLNLTHTAKCNVDSKWTERTRHCMCVSIYPYIYTIRGALYNTNFDYRWHNAHLVAI